MTLPLQLTNTQYWIVSMGSTTFRKKSLSMLGYGYRAQERLGAVHTLRLLSIHCILIIRSQNRKRRTQFMEITATT